MRESGAWWPSHVHEPSFHERCFFFKEKCLFHSNTHIFTGVEPQDQVSHTKSGLKRMCISIQNTCLESDRKLQQTCPRVRGCFSLPLHTKALPPKKYSFAFRRKSSVSITYPNSLVPSCETEEQMGIFKVPGACGRTSVHIQIYGDDIVMRSMGKKKQGYPALAAFQNGLHRTVRNLEEQGIQVSSEKTGKLVLSPRRRVPLTLPRLRLHERRITILKFI